MYIVIVSAVVKPQFVGPFIEATRDNASNTRSEPGNLRFDVIQAEDDPARFTLYEAYLTRDDFLRHQQTAHYLRWKQKVADWMAQPRSSVKGEAVFFGDETA